MKSKIIYMVLVLATLWAAAAGRGEFAFFLLVFELLFAVCMAAGEDGKFCSHQRRAGKIYS